MQNIRACVSLCHTFERAIHPSMHERCRTAAISAPFTPLAAFRFQPLPTVAIHGINLGISIHHSSRRLRGSALTTITILDVGLGVGLERCSQASQCSALAATTWNSCNRRRWRRWRGYGVDKAAPSHYETASLGIPART